ncbi:hypothetical protein HJC23_006271 [Cyclotella cryptica]|uniref:Cyclin-D1-binding protein 1-like N-terminal domain-containing protein n=1 Tax=Cyclotella cryptica TaxID=29204 RepID=A0ABD3PLD5_9STRA|eukprot:CCRYP_013458-RA/>CCRYP_013458-RA protein AED:0.10 eAED:0.10 QI:0/-1/0/1/-1/1/1/0/424
MASSGNLNTKVLDALTRLAETLAQLDERGFKDVGESSSSPAQRLHGHETAMDEITRTSAALTLSQADSNAPQSTAPTTQLSHYRIQPPALVEAYALLTTGSQYIHATSTKYTLVSKIDYETEGGNLAVELRKGAELLGTATLAVFSPEMGCGPSAKRYVKQFSRGVIASVISLVEAFENGSAIGGAENHVGAQKTGAVWSACDAIQQLPKGNRNSMRRECMVWIRDCMESVTEFEDIMKSGEREDAEGEDEDDMIEEEMYTPVEMKIVRAAVNVMKCSKNVLGLVMKACDCVGECIENLTTSDSTEIPNSNDATVSRDNKTEMLQWIYALHEVARSIGEGVTDFGILLYPPLDLSDSPTESSLSQQLNNQLQALEKCVTCIHDSSFPLSGMSMQSCMSDEVVEMTERLLNGIKTRVAEVKSAMS